jgi:hypothetical protein
MITKIESLLDKELANVHANEDICSDILGNQKSKILQDRMCNSSGGRGHIKAIIWSKAV